MDQSLSNVTGTAALVLYQLVSDDSEFTVLQKILTFLGCCAQLFGYIDAKQPELFRVCLESVSRSWDNLVLIGRNARTKHAREQLE